MKPVVQKSAVSQPSKQGVAEADAKALLAPNALIGFYEAALHKAKLQASAKSSRTAERVIDAEEEEASAALAEAEAQAQAEAEALLSGVVEAEPPTVLLSATTPAASEPAKATAQPFTTDNPLAYVLPALLLGTALGGSDSSAAAAAPTTDDHCQIDFDFPNRPTGATVETLSVANRETEVQASGSPMVLADGKSLVVELGTLSELSGSAGNFLVTASGNVGDLYFDLGNDSSIQMLVDVSGGVGDIAMHSKTDTEGGGTYANVSAGGDVGHVTLFAEAVDAGGNLNIDTTGGDVAQVDGLFVNPDGYGNMYVSAYAAVSGLSLVGGNVGDVSLAVEGAMSEGKIYAQAYGGNIGDVELIACGGSASGRINVSAIAQIDGNGSAVGGNIGDVTLVTHGASAESDVSALAFGILSGGQYLGGGNIGNVLITAGGDSANAAAGLYSFSGGSIGTITLLSSSAGVDNYNVSANVSAVVHGAGGQVATIGDVTMDIYGNTESSGTVNLGAFSGGNIGTITATVTSQTSGHININASAYVNASGSGGNIGAISLTDTSYAGDHDLYLYAESSIGNVSASLGGGSGQIRMHVNADVDAVVGTISVAFDSEHYGSGSDLYLGMASGATGADISITGGSINSSFKITANDIDYAAEYTVQRDFEQEGPYIYLGAKVAGDIDMSNFAGFSEIDLNTVEAGVSIEVGEGGSSVLGSLGADTIILGAGSDQISFANLYYDSDLESIFFTPTDTDTITGFDALADETDAMDSFYMERWGGGDLIELTANAATALNNNEAVTLVDLAGGQVLSTTEGLLAALNGGEYALVDGRDGDKYTFATASATTATSFNLFRVEHEGGVFTNASLLAEVSMTGSTFANLSTDNFDLF